MKRLFLLLMTIAQLFSCAHAVPQTPYSSDTLVLYHLQSPAVQRLIDLLYEGVMRGETEISLPPGTRYDDANLAWLILTDEFPEILHLSNHGSIVYYLDAPEYAISVRLEYTMSLEEYAAAYARLMDAARPLAASASGTAYERELFLHDALAERVTYKGELFSNNTSDAYGALVRNQALCEGYAHALTLLCRLSGIPCSMVVGTASNGMATDLHAWNAVIIEGELLLTDCTFNDHDAKGPLVHWYFNLPAQEMAATHHSGTLLPLSDTDAWTYTRQNGGYIASVSDMQSVFDAQYARMRETGKPMELKAADDALFRLLINSIETLMADSPYHIGTLTYSTGSSVRSITLTEVQE